MLRLWRQFTVSLDLDANNKLNCKIWSLSNSSYLSCEAFAQKCAKVCAYAYLFNSLIHCFVFFVCLSLCVYIFLKFINSLIYFQCTFWAEAGIFHEKKVNMIVADGLTPSIIRSSAAMLLVMKDKLFLICHQAIISTICPIQLLRNDGKCNVLVFLHNNSTRKSTKTAVDSCFTEINTQYMHHSHWTSEKNKIFLVMPQICEASLHHWRQQSNFDLAAKNQVMSIREFCPNWQSLDCWAVRSQTLGASSIGGVSWYYRWNRPGGPFTNMD